jgi:eukaryotic translation initiation factor 2-alpha kinase 4
LHSIGLASREKLGQPKLVKLLKVAYYVKLLDLHRSNPFGLKSLPVMDSPNLPESWWAYIPVSRCVSNFHRLAKDGHDSALIYTKARDIHYAGVIFLQMILGRDVVERFPDAQAALICSESFPRFMNASQKLQPRYPRVFNELRRAWSRKRKDIHHVPRFLEN